MLKMETAKILLLLLFMLLGGILFSDTNTVNAQSERWCYSYKDGNTAGERCASRQKCEIDQASDARQTSSCRAAGTFSISSVETSKPISFVPLQGIKGFIETGQEKDIAGFLNSAFRFGVGAAAVLAVLMIILGGFEYMTSDAPGMKSDGKEKIAGAILGIVIILLSGLILSIINPDILQFRFFGPS